MIRILFGLVIGTLITLGLNFSLETVIHYFKNKGKFDLRRDHIAQNLNYKGFDEGFSITSKSGITPTGESTVRIARCYSGNRIIFESPISDFYIDGSGNINIKKLVGNISFVTKAVCVIQ